MNVSIITILRDGTHLDYWREIDGDSIEAAAESVVAPHVNDRLAFYPESLIDRFIVVAGSLSWKIEIATGAHDLYRPALQLVANKRIDVTAEAGGQVIARTSVDSGEKAAIWIDGVAHGSALRDSDVFGPRKEKS